MSTQIILLERVENLGNMGDVVSVRPGYARNYLLPQKKALRASKTNLAYFEAQKKHLQAENDKRKAGAEKLAGKLKGLTVVLVRQASEAGQLFGSVAARDIAVEVAKKSGEAVDRSMVQLNQNYKLIGLFPVDVTLHPEVKVSVTVNIARSVEEAETQARTGKALIAGQEQGPKAKAPVSEDEALADVLEDSALEAQKEKRTQADAQALKDQEKEKIHAGKKAKKAEKAKAKQSEEPEQNAMMADVDSDDE